MKATEKTIQQVITKRKQGVKEASRFVSGLITQALQRRREGKLDESLALVEVGLRLMHNHRPLLDLQAVLKQEISQTR